MILVCGDSEISRTIRKTVIETMEDYPNVEFVETEFQPQGVRQAYPGIHALHKDRVEMGSMAVVKSVTRKKELIKSRLSLHNLASKRMKSSTNGEQNDSEGLIKEAGKLDTLEEMHTIDVEAQLAGVQIREIV